MLPRVLSAEGRKAKRGREDVEQERQRVAEGQGRKDKGRDRGGRGEGGLKGLWVILLFTGNQTERARGMLLSKLS